MREIKMLQEIKEQPEALLRVWQNRLQIQLLSKKLSNKKFVFFTAFGSSYHAGLYGQFLFSHCLGIPSMAFTPSFFLEKNQKLSYQRKLVVAISQSGEVKEVVEAAALLKKKGAFILAMTNNTNSKLARISDELLPLLAGPEKSVPATKTFTTTLFTLQLLTALWGAKSLLASLAKIPDISLYILQEEKKMEALAKQLAKPVRALILAPEPLRAIAQEGALKLKECTYMMAEAFEWHEFFHGPIALMEKETPALFLRDIKDPKTSTHLVKRLKEASRFTYDISTPTILQIRNPILAPIGYAILLQMLALHTALEKKINPDRPRRLHKVLRTSI
jgi:glucosamine--fructose-6-phosphate aminotransferase (isomerizing)